MPTTVGIILDTHGLLRPEAVAAFHDVALIIRAGDVGAPTVLEALSRLAPVFAVRGNIDRDDSLPSARTVEVERARICVLHDLGELDFEPAARGCAAVISGHEHRGLCAMTFRYRTGCPNC
jgi:hypothetical protein